MSFKKKKKKDTKQLHLHIRACFSTHKRKKYKVQRYLNYQRSKVAVFSFNKNYKVYSQMRHYQSHTSKNSMHTQKIWDMNVFTARRNIKIDLITWSKYELLLWRLSKLKHTHREIPWESSARSKPYQAHITSTHLWWSGLLWQLSFMNSRHIWTYTIKSHTLQEALNENGSVVEFSACLLVLST